MSTDLTRARGAVVYRGPSLLDGAPIVVVATGLRRPSQNSKTGHMIQTWILRSDVHPVESVHVGADSSICGIDDCPLRPANANGGPQCYVNKGFGPAAVFRALQRDSYPDAAPADVRSLAEARGLAIRFGAYGDPGAVPDSVWQSLATNRRTGYTHQWRRRPTLRSLTMASADTLAGAEVAWSDGWRTFRVIRNVNEVTAREILCPASAEMGHRTQCADCRLCDGARANDRRKSIAIVDHGPTAPRVK